MMTQPEPFSEVDAAISSACSQFVEQARLALPLDRVAVVLLDAEGDASRVVFAWRAPGSVTASDCSTVGVDIRECFSVSETLRQNKPPVASQASIAWKHRLGQ